jgi:predicted HTH domain antitoxin
MTIPDEILLALKLDPEAVNLYELGQLSSGAAAHLAGLPKPVFMTKLADYGVCLQAFRLRDRPRRAERLTGAPKNVSLPGPICTESLSAAESERRVLAAAQCPTDLQAKLANFGRTGIAVHRVPPHYANGGRP